jgi:hypothetical protein
MNSNNVKYVNTSEVRAGALYNFILLVLALYLGVSKQSTLLAIILIYLVLSFYTSARGKPLSINTIVNKKLKVAFGEGESEPSLPVRFSAKIGIILTFVSLLTISLGNTSIIFIILCLIASALNAFTGICIACKLYPRFTLLKHKLKMTI